MCFSLFTWFAFLKCNAFFEPHLWGQPYKPFFSVALAQWKHGMSYALLSSWQAAPKEGGMWLWSLSPATSEVKCSVRWDVVLCGSARWIPALLWISHLLWYCTLPPYYSYCFFHSHLFIFLHNLFLFSSSLPFPASFSFCVCLSLAVLSSTGSGLLYDPGLCFFLVCSAFPHFSSFPSVISSPHLYLAWHVKLV